MRGDLLALAHFSKRRLKEGKKKTTGRAKETEYPQKKEVEVNNAGVANKNSILPEILVSICILKYKPVREAAGMCF